VTGSRPPQPRQTLTERVAALEKHAKWWRNPGWWAVIVAAVVAFNQITPWEWFEHPKPKPPPPPARVKLVEPHATAYAPYQWEADVRVINNTNRNIKVERVTAVFGKASYGRKCDKTGNATRILYPVPEPGQARNLYQPLQRGEGAPFRGGPNLDRAFGGKRCPLAVAKLSLPQHTATFTVLTDDGKTWSITTTLLYQPKFRVEGAGGGGLPCLPFLPFTCP
jgi:hypothetical protein